MNEQIVMDNLGLIYDSIKKMNLTWKNEDEFRDYFDDGLMGMMYGISKFEPERGNKLSTFLVACIRSQILKGITAKTSQMRKNTLGSDISLNAEIGENHCDEFGDFIPLEAPEIIEQIEAEIQKEALMKAISNLKKDVDKKVVEMRFGLNGNEEMTYKQIGDVINRTPKVVEIRVKRVLKDLKSLVEKEERRIVRGI